MSLYQKYRPGSFSDVVGQEFVRTSLQNSLKNDTLSHVYIFYGSHGTGKTSLARIFSKWMNCLERKKDGESCDTCANCIAANEGKMLDIIEIDGASHTGVDNVRELIETARYQPTQGAYKIYIIDEVHMLSKGAFNALLKILEEPPVHVKFILATTEIEKIPDTILSRSLRFDFGKIQTQDIENRLEYIAKKEKISCDEWVLEIIAKTARWGLRDAIATFEQFILDGSIEKERVEKFLHIFDDAFYEDLASYCLAWNGEQVTIILDELEKRYIDVARFFESFQEFIIAYVRKNITKDISGYLKMFEIFSSYYEKIKITAYPFMLIQVACYEVVSLNNFSSSLEEIKTVPEIQKKIEKKSPKIEEKENKKEGEKKEIKEKESEKKVEWEEKKSIPHEVKKDLQPFSPQNLIKELQKNTENAALVTALKPAKISYKDNLVSITVSNAFIKKKLEEQKNVTILQESLQALLGEGDITISVIVHKIPTLGAEDIFS